MDRHRLWIGLLLSALYPYLAIGQGYPPEEAAARMTVPPGFEVTLVASEPTITQPVAIEFDRKGRLWVLQYIQYPNPEGLIRAKVDRFSRTTYDRIPEPPPKGPRGSDRVTILEDKDGDGRFEASKDFVSGLNLTTGIAFGHGGVFLLQVPYLLFYPDANGDDVPDADPEVLLTGFGMEDAHSVANSLTWGPDGWLYGCQGSTVTANIRGIEFQQGVWRYHPRTRAFELFCEGGGNSWGLDFDAHGNLFYSTNNGPFCMLHGVQGGYYWKSFGKHGALHNPHAYGYFEHVVHDNFRGGHVTVGGIIYQGDSLPQKFRGKYIAANLLSHDVYWHTLKETGSTYRSAHAGELLLSNDTWFAPSDVTMGPDGGIYVADWHDARTAHPDPDAEWDRSNGRIYRIQVKDHRASPVRDLTSLASQELVGTLRDTNDWYVRRARELLAERRDAQAIEALQAILKAEQNDSLSLQALWGLYVSGGFTETLALELLRHPSPDIRWWTVRYLGDQQAVSPATAAALLKLATEDTSLRVRSQLASTAKRLPAASGLPIVRTLILHDDAEDLHLPLLLWWALEDKAITNAEAIVADFSTEEIWNTRTGRNEILPRLIRRYAAEGNSDGYVACAKLLASTPSAEARQSLLAAIEVGIAAKHLTNPPPPLLPLVAELLQANDLPSLRLAVRLGSEEAMKRMLQLLSGGATSHADRKAIVTILAERGEPRLVPLLLPLLDPQRPSEEVVLALDGLGPFAQPTIADQIMKGYHKYDDSEKTRARSLLFSRSDWALAFLQRIDTGLFAKDDIPMSQLQALGNHKNATIDDLVVRHWGSVREATPEEVLAEVRRLNNDLRAAKGDANKGQAVFTKKCATCHLLYGSGNKVGPDLTTANRKDRDYLLISLVDPSVVIRKEFLAYSLSTHDGRLLTGLIVEQDSAAVTLLDAKNEKTRVPVAEIAEMKESAVSLMPSNLYKELSPTELRDLFAYLQSESPP